MGTIQWISFILAIAAFIGWVVVFCTSRKSSVRYVSIAPLSWLSFVIAFYTLVYLYHHQGMLSSAILNTISGAIRIQSIILISTGAYIISRSYVPKQDNSIKGSVN